MTVENILSVLGYTTEVMIAVENSKIECSIQCNNCFSLHSDFQHFLTKYFGYCEVEEVRTTYDYKERVSILVIYVSYKDYRNSLLDVVRSKKDEFKFSLKYDILLNDDRDVWFC